MLFRSTMVETYKSQNKASHISIYFRDLTNGPWIGIDENTLFTPASLLKLPPLMTYYKMAETKPDVLREEVLVTQESVDQNRSTEQFVYPKISVTPNKTYTVEELLTSLIRYSDNVAWFALIGHAPLDQIIEVYADLGLPYPTVGGQSDFISVHEYSSFFRVLYNASYLNQEMSERALRLLSTTDFTDGLKKGVPANVVVAHKFGERLLSEDVRQFHKRVS